MKKKTIQFGVSIVKNIFTFMKYDTIKFLIICSFLVGLITWLIIILSSENIELDKNGFKVKKKSVNIEKHIFQRKR